MNIRIKKLIIPLILILLPVLVFSQNLPGVRDSYNIRLYDTSMYIDENNDRHVMEIMNLPRQSWLPLPESFKLPVRDKTVWLKISLPEGVLGQDLYLTEHFGLQSWDVFFLSEGLLLDQDTVSWVQGDNHRFNMHDQFFGFSSFQIFNSNHKDVVLLLRLNPRYGLYYDFYLRGRVNFQTQYNTWVFMQGAGVGIILVVILLTLVMSLKLMYRIDWLYLALVVSTGLNISYYTGMGPSLTSALTPWITYSVWTFITGLFCFFSILFIQEFSQIPKESRYVRRYFRAVKILSIAFPLVLTLIPEYLTLIILQFGYMFLFILILFGLLRLVSLRTNQALWIMTGWVLLVLFVVFGNLLKLKSLDIQVLPVSSYILGYGLFLIFLGTALIKHMDQMRESELRKRKSAEHIAESVLKRMGEHKRMADLGEMVSSVTHELGTPLGVTVTLSSNMSNIGHNIQQLFLDGELSEDEFRQFMTDVLESSELIEKNMENARLLIDGFKQVAADQAAPDVRDINLFHYVSQIVRILMTQIKRSPYTLNQYIPDDITIRSNPGILTQVITNLVNNAVIHGFENRKEGEINIKAERIKKDEKDYIQLIVEDNGNGISPDIQKKVFNMYFTTKKGFGGTGVGLSIVKSLVEERLNGTISLTSEPGRGTTFTILIPEKLEGQV